MLDEIKDQITDLNSYPESLEDSKMLAGRLNPMNRTQLLLLRAAVAGSISQRSQMSGFTSNSVNSEGAQIIDYLYSESSGTETASLMRN